MKSGDLFRAFADPTRLRILNLLDEQKELCVCDLCAALGESQPKVSRHLADAAPRPTRGRTPRGQVDVLLAWRPRRRRFIGPSLRCVSSCLGDIDELVGDRARLRGLALRLRCS